MVAVVMGGETSNDRFNGAKKLLDYGFANFSLASLDAQLDADAVLPVTGGVQKQVRLCAPETLSLLMKKNSTEKVERNVVLPKSVRAPIQKGDQVGTVELSVGGEVVGEIPIQAAESVEEMNYAVALGWMLRGLLSN